MEIPDIEAGIPHRSVSANAIFSTQEALLKFVREGGDAYICLYDLEKHLVQNSPLAPFQAWHGKCWRLIKSWYTNPESTVKHAGLSLRLQRS